MMPKVNVELMLDSGAFSCWNNNIHLDVYQYADYILENQHNLDTVICLDVIPGTSQKRATPSDIEYASKKGYENLQVLRSLGIPAIPVFHFGEKLYWLERFVDEGYNYIGLGGMARRPYKPFRVWLDSVFTFLSDSSGWPIVKVHGFGTTSIKLMLRYPWYTVDSTTWMQVGSYGSIYVPKCNPDGTYNYDVAPKTVFLSDRKENPSSKVEGFGFHSMGQSERNYVLRYLHHIGVHFDDVCRSYVVRAEANCKFLLAFQDNHRVQPFHIHEYGFFNKKSPFSNSTAKQHNEHLTILPACITNHEYNLVLNKLGINKRLMTYFLMHQAKNLDLDYYITHGMFPRSGGLKRARLENGTNQTTQCS